MRISRLGGILRRSHRLFNTLILLAFINFLYALNHLTTVYINSTLLGQFFSAEMVSILFIISALLSILAIIVAPTIIARLGVWKTLVISIPLLQASLIFLGFAGTAFAAFTFFMFRTIFARSIPYLLDLYVESVVKDESRTGNARGTYLTGYNIGAILGPIIASVLVIGTNYAPAYIFSAVILLPLLYLVVIQLKKLTPATPEPGHLIESLKGLWTCHISVRYTMFVHLIFRSTTAAYGIYVPLYLVQAGYSWQVIGMLIAFAVIPYFLLEYPIGLVVDNLVSEKKIMIIGLFILAFATASLSLIPVTYIALWAIPFIFTRVGAAFIEISTESYFFKQVTEQDSSLISIFRVLSPLGVIVAPAVALLFLPITDLQWLFGFMGALILLGVPPALRIHNAH